MAEMATLTTRVPAPLLEYGLDQREIVSPSSTCSTSRASPTLITPARSWSRSRQSSRRCCPRPA
jgi:hypothetical protein